MRRITLQASINTFTGYGQMFHEIFAGFEQRGYFCAVRPIDVSEPFGAEVPLIVKSRFVHCPQPEEIEILIKNPNQCPTPGKKTIYYTMYESTVLPKEWVEILNKATVVMVPSEWNRKGFTESGVTVPMVVNPLGVNPHIFNWMPPHHDNVFRFGVAGRMAHGPKRKGVRRAIDLFIETFPNIKDVELMVKVHPDCDIGEVKDKRIKIIRDHMPWHKVREWFGKIDVFLSLAQAEGFGLWQLQAMACGRPVMAAKFSGMAEYLDKENGFCLPFSQVDNPDYGGGKWAHIGDDEVRRAMLYAYSNRKEVEEKGRQASDDATAFHWGRTVNQLCSIVGEVQNGIL